MLNVTRTWNAVTALAYMRRALEAGGLAPLTAEMQRCADAVRHETLAEAVQQAQEALAEAGAWLDAAQEEGRPTVEAGARRFALTLGHAFELALLARHAQWALDEEGDVRPAAAARRLAAQGISRIAPVHLGEASLFSEEAPAHR